MSKVRRVEFPHDGLDSIVGDIVLSTGDRQKPSWRGLRRHWRLANPSVIEFRTATWNGPFVVFSMTGTSGQAGAIGVWDTRSRRWCHVSEAAYVRCACLLPDATALVTLCRVSHWGIQPYFLLTVTSMDSLRDGSTDRSKIVRRVDDPPVDRNVSAPSSKKGGPRAEEICGPTLRVDGDNLIAADLDLSLSISLVEIHAHLRAVPT